MKFFHWLRERLSRKTITMVLDPELIEMEKDCTVMTGGGGRKYTREMAKRLSEEHFEKKKAESTCEGCGTGPNRCICCAHGVDCPQCDGKDPCACED